MVDLIRQALSKGAKIYSSISGGKDGQAMTKMLHEWGFQMGTRSYTSIYYGC